MTSKFKRIDTLYKRNSQLDKLSKRVQQIKNLDTIFQQALPPQFATHCYLVNINENTLIVHTDNASYASLLRFQAQALCAEISKHLPQIVNSIDVRVRPKTTTNSTTKTTQTHLPESASKALEQTAESLDNEPLKAALERLAKRRNK